MSSSINSQPAVIEKPSALLSTSSNNKASYHNNNISNNKHQQIINAGNNGDVDGDGDDDEGDLPSVSIRDFMVVDEQGNPKLSSGIDDDVSRDIPYLNELATSPASSPDTTMFVRRKDDPEAITMMFVLKRITPDSFSKSLAKLAMARREAKALRKLSHVNLVHLHEVFHEEENGHLYVLGEYVPGGNLANMIRSQNGILFDEETIVGWFRQMVAGVQHLHSKYIIHGNIKPENVLLSSNFKMARLSDFGLSKIFHIVGLSFFARPGYSTSQLYAAPETCQVRDEIDDEMAATVDDIFSAGEKADVWSLGVVVYELCALKRPFDSIRMIMTKEPDLLTNELSDELKQTISKMLAKQPWQRIDIGQVANEPALSIKRILRAPTSKTGSRFDTNSSGLDSKQDEEEAPNYTIKEFETWQAYLNEGIDKDSGVLVAKILREVGERSPVGVQRLLSNRFDNPFKETPLHRAARQGKAEAVKALSAAGAIPNAINRDFDMPLHLASIEGHAKCVDALLDASVAERDMKGDAGRTALHMATAANHPECVQALLAHGANPNERSSAPEDFETTPLHFASFFGYIEIISMLLAAGASTDLPDTHGDQPLHAAARNGQRTACEVLIERGEADKEALGYNGRSALHHAIQGGFGDVIEALVAHGVDINAKNPQDKQERTPLHLAVARKNLQIINLLIAHKAAWLRGDVNGDTALHFAASRGYASVVENFLDKGLNADTENTRTGWTALHTAAATGHRNCIVLLLKRGADIEAISNVQDGRRTPLHVAILNGHVEAARLLLQSGANIMAQDGYGEVALVLAAKNDKPYMIRLLTENFGANVDCRSADAMTPLHHACQRDRYYAAKALLERMASVELRNVGGMTPFAEAVANGSTVCAELLWSWGADTEAADSAGNAPIHTAVLKGQCDLIKFLVRRAHVNIEAIGQQTKLTPLQLACRENIESAVQILLKLGADKNVKTGDDIAQSPLQIAAVNGFDKVVYALILAGANVDIPNYRNETALMLAVQANRVNCARILLRDGKANVEKVGHLGRRVVHYAIEAKSLECVKVVALDYNASLDCADDAKEKPFEMAARLGYVEIGGVLLSKQRDVLDQVNPGGETALHVAAKHGQLEFVKFLVEQGSNTAKADKQGSLALQLAESSAASESGDVASYLKSKQRNENNNKSEQPQLMQAPSSQEESRKEEEPPPAPVENKAEIVPEEKPAAAVI